MRASREEWRKRIERWKDSGLSAKEFAAETGIKATTLGFWKYKLGKEAREVSTEAPRSSIAELPATLARAKRKKREPRIPLPLVEIRPSVAGRAGVFELQVGAGRRLRIPPDFDAAALLRLVEVLGRGAP